MCYFSKVTFVNARERLIGGWMVSDAGPDLWLEWTDQSQVWQMMADVQPS